MYQIVSDRLTAAKLGALDLVNDVRYTLPVEIITDKLRAANKRVFRYVIDQSLSLCDGLVISLVS